MKTTSINLRRLLALLALLSWLSMDLATARVAIYSQLNQQGASMSLGTNTYDDRYFARFFEANPKSRYCSFKIPRGYQVEVDYYGYGFDDPRTRTYTRSLNRLGRSFRRIRIRRAPRVPGGGTGAPDIRCGSDWGAKLYTESYYKGSGRCMGEETILPTQKPKSFKVRSGYVLILFRQGQEVKRFTKNTSYFNWPFDYVRVMKDYSASQSTPSNARLRTQGRSTKSRGRSRGKR